MKAVQCLPLVQSQTIEAARRAGIELLSLPVKSAVDISSALAMARDRKVSALIVAADPLTVANGRQIIERCISMKLPAMHTVASEARLGAPMAYGIDGG